MSDHIHKFKTRYITLDYRYECASGMECECGFIIRQDEVEIIVNEWEQKALATQSAV